MTENEPQSNGQRYQEKNQLNNLDPSLVTIGETRLISHLYHTESGDGGNESRQKQRLQSTHGEKPYEDKVEEDDQYHPQNN